MVQHCLHTELDNQDGFSDRPGGGRRVSSNAGNERQVPRRPHTEGSAWPLWPPFLSCLIMGLPGTVTEQGGCACALTHASVTEGTPGSEVLSHRWAGNPCRVCARVCLCPCVSVWVWGGSPVPWGARCVRGAHPMALQLSLLCASPSIALGVSPQAGPLFLLQE